MTTGITSSLQIQQVLEKRIKKSSSLLRPSHQQTHIYQSSTSVVPTAAFGLSPFLWILQTGHQFITRKCGAA
jgi:hypothetical protein